MISEGEPLACPHCGADKFIAVVALHWKPGGGVITAPAGYACLGCQREADNAEMIEREKLKRGWNPNEGE
jgi:DNA-directed RNA polymerase subunit RPC12/RpoP